MITTEKTTVYNETLLELISAQAHGDYNRVNEIILEAEELEGDAKEAADYFEINLANEEYANWHAKNSCGYDNV